MALRLSRERVDRAPTEPRSSTDHHYYLREQQRFGGRGLQHSERQPHQQLLAHEHRER